MTKKLFVDSLVGTSSDDRAVYNFGMMVDELVKKWEISPEEAVEHIDYNIIRSLPMYGEKAPIIYDPLMF